MNTNIETYADGYGRWHATASFSPAYFEERMTTEKAVSACKRAIRREINERMKPIKCKRLSYQVTRNWVSWDTGVDVRSIDVMENTDG
tara:strand:+ start:1052 stop:1315 length:264 start_codon:yes stop_codon:yes gene_type:complete